MVVKSCCVKRLYSSFRPDPTNLVSISLTSLSLKFELNYSFYNTPELRWLAFEATLRIRTIRFEKFWDTTDYLLFLDKIYLIASEDVVLVMCYFQMDTLLLPSWLADLRWNLFNVIALVILRLSSDVKIKMIAWVVITKCLQIYATREVELFYFSFRIRSPGLFLCLLFFFDSTKFFNEYDQTAFLWSRPRVFICESLSHFWMFCRYFILSKQNGSR